MNTHFTEEQKKSARKSNLYDYLLYNHNDLFTKEGKSIRFNNDTSIVIKENYSGYINFATGETGNSIDFLVNYLDYTVNDAILSLIGYTIDHVPIYSPHTAILPNQIEDLPPEFPDALNGLYKHLYAYLINRGIHKDTIRMLIDNKLIYEDIHKNIVFINNIKDWGEIRGTNTYADKNCKKMRICPDYQDNGQKWCQYMNTCPKYRKSPFRGMIANARTDGFWYFKCCDKKDIQIVYICEASIDAISLYELHRKNHIDNSNAAYVSIGGASKQQTIERIKKGYHCIIAVDNDEAGNLCRTRNSDCESIIPIHKDWNDDLCT